MPPTAVPLLTVEVQSMGVFCRGREIEALTFCVKWPTPIEVQKHDGGRLYMINA